MDPSISAIDRQPLQDHCGILALFSPKNSQKFQETLSAHQELQTRGYDGAGFWAIDSKGREFSHKGSGMIREVFKPNSALVKKFSKIKAQTWVFQNRYGTAGTINEENIQPIRRLNLPSGEVFVVAHNGQFSKKNENDYEVFSDTVTFANQLAKTKQKTWSQRIAHTLKSFKGAYSLIIATRNSIYTARDSFGLRPLVFGRLTDKLPHTWVIASETTSLEKLGATHYTEVMPGSIIKFTSTGIITIKKYTQNTKKAYCVFENVYLMEEHTQAHIPTKQSVHIRNHPSVNLVRYRSGQILATQAPISKKSVDFICGVPGTGISGGQGFANALRIPYIQAIVDAAMPINEQRTFMDANIDSILQKVAKHFSFEKEILANKRIVLVDDSLVRGNVMVGLIRLLRELCDVRVVHVRIVCPPIDKPCHLGINTRSENELLANQFSANVTHMKKFINADSLQFLSPSGLLEAITNNPDSTGFCMGCMHGKEAPIDVYGKKQ